MKAECSLLGEVCLRFCDGTQLSGEYPLKQAQDTTRDRHTVHPVEEYRGYAGAPQSEAMSQGTAPVH